MDQRAQLHAGASAVQPEKVTLRERPRKERRPLGAALLIAVIAVVIAYTLWPGGDSSDPTAVPGGGGGLTVVKGYGGRLKEDFLEDPEVAKILAERYGLAVDITAVGSIDLACGRSFGPDDDFVWLGDSVALTRYQDLGQTYPERGCSMLRADSVYNSPLVLYSWTPIVDALVAAGVAQATPDGAYTVDFARFVDLMMQGATWADLGLPQLHGRIVVHTTDPARSNSGFLFAGLLANTRNGGDVVNATTVEPLLPEVHDYFLRLGYMEARSGDLFAQFLITGMGAKPIVALYESQIPEFLASNPSYADQIRQNVRILYPQPTLWASHPFVARTDNGARLLDALMDPDIQQLAWKRHGQRPGVPGVLIDPTAMPIPGILPQITSVTTMPRLDVMDRILAEIAAPAGASTTPDSSPLAPTPTVTPTGQGRRRTRPCWPSCRHLRRIGGLSRYALQRCNPSQGS